MNNIFNLNTLYWRYKTYLKLNFLDKQGLAVHQHPPETKPVPSPSHTFPI